MDKALADKIWYWYMTGEWRVEPAGGMPLGLRILSPIYRAIPSAPHCFECGIPMAGVGGSLLRFNGSAPSSFSSRLCSGCEQMARSQESGAEVELSMLFADVRGSTPLAESTSTSEYKDLIQRFYKTTSQVLIEHNAMVNRLMGDQVIALFVPRFAGKEHAAQALQAARELLQATGHAGAGGPWVPVGVGVHTGMAYVGAVGSGNGVNEIAVLGSAANLCARLSASARAGEILISDDAVKASRLEAAGLESRSLELKGFSQPIGVRVVKV
jgi:adenylate cyclase